MKLLASLFLISFALFAQQENLFLYCSYPTTEFNLKVSNESGVVKLYVNHPYGAQYTPIHDGTVVPVQIPELQRKADMLKKLGNLELHWPKENCVQKGELISCEKGFSNMIAGTKVRAFNFYSFKVAEEGIRDNLQYIKLHLSFIIDGELYHVNGKYAYDVCRF